ncbi:MAG: hypothetical protein IPI04_00145 [Ignavibacteria bacterium]|nr:hypothetical protein [Ignavibacteria bacterium]
MNIRTLLLVTKKFATKEAQNLKLYKQTFQTTNNGIKSPYLRCLRFFKITASLPET